MIQRIKITYIASEAIAELDDDICDAMFNIGFEEYGREYYFQKKERDISFERTVEDQKETIYTGP